jgi:hypothetical protein
MCSSTYKIATRGMNVENLDVPLEFQAVVDSGTSFTYLADPVYTAFAYEVSAYTNQKESQTIRLSSVIPEFLVLQK